MPLPPAISGPPSVSVPAFGYLRCLKSDFDAVNTNVCPFKSACSRILHTPLGSVQVLHQCVMMGGGQTQITDILVLKGSGEC